MNLETIFQRSDLGGGGVEGGWGGGGEGERVVTFSLPYIEDEWRP